MANKTYRFIRQPHMQPSWVFDNTYRITYNRGNLIIEEKKGQDWERIFLYKPKRVIPGKVVNQQIGLCNQ